TPLGREIGLVDDERWKHYQNKVEQINELRNYLKNTRITPTEEIREALEEVSSGNLSQPASLEKILRRPAIEYKDLNRLVDNLPEYPSEITEQIEIAVKYEGYIERQLKQVKQFEKLENKLLPEELDYQELDNLRQEAREKLNKVKPRSVGQASRIAGVSPADIQVLMIYLEKRKKSKEKDGFEGEIENG
ncbi:MAG: tRNA uridine-5-carboxymethylaminomethyl(34) synthesis enzyme MnmG, partial [Halarsenatibacteraceae bacterium]